MTLLVPRAGERDALAFLINKASPQDLVLCLFSNDVEPSETDTALSYVEPKGHGYEAIRLRGSDWRLSEGSPLEASYAQQVFTFEGGLGDVYGYFLKRASSGRIAWAERFDGAPHTVKHGGEQIKVTPRIGLRS